MYSASPRPATSSARRSASSKSGLEVSTTTPSSRMPSSFDAGVVPGANTWRRTPSAAAAAARARPWLPAEAVTTGSDAEPRSPRRSRACIAPRYLKERVRCSDSSFSQTWRPLADPSACDSMSGVRRTRPRSLSAAPATSSCVTGMLIESYAVAAFEKNGYVVACERTREAVVIDPGDEVPSLVEAVTRLGLQVRYILLTHSHLAHISGCNQAKAAFGAPLVLHRDDLFL